MKNLKGVFNMIIAYGDLKEATWAMRAHGRIRTLAITNGKKKEKLQFKLDDDCVYLFCKNGKPYEIGNKLLYNILSDILIFIADTDKVDDAINEIMIALL